MDTVLSPASDEGQRLNQALLRARRSLLIKRIRSDLRTGSELASIVVCLLALAACARILSIGFSTMSSAEIGEWIFLNVFTVLLILLWKVVPDLMSPPSYAEVAERLDLATHGQNRIATAEELQRLGGDCPFDAAAIADGLLHLGRVQDVAPFQPTPPSRLPRSALLVAVAAALIIVSALRPGRLQGGKGTNRSDPFAVAIDVAPIDAVSPAASRPKPPDRQTSSHDVAGPPPFSESAAQFSVKESGANALANRSDAATASSAVAGEPGLGPPPRDGAGQAGTADKASAGDLSHTVASAALQREVPAPPPAAERGGAGSPREPHGGAAKDKQSGGKSGDGKPDPANQGSGGSGNQAPPPDAPPPDASGADGSGGGPETDIDLPKSGGSSAALTTGTDPHGDGKSMGQSQPKKSRGVAPLLLGTELPDLLQGKPLPGPDERMKLQVPPQRNPTAPAAPATVAGRAGDEPPVNRFDVPTALRGMVGTYFQRFHDDAPTLAKP